MTSILTLFFSLVAAGWSLATWVSLYRKRGIATHEVEPLAHENHDLLMRELLRDAFGMDKVSGRTRVMISMLMNSYQHATLWHMDEYDMIEVGQLWLNEWLQQRTERAAQ